MSLPKVAGIETEFAIVVPGAGREERGDAAERVVAGCGRTGVSVGADDYMMANGARWYVDLEHPEYATPECTNPLELVACEKAGERIAARAASRAGETPGEPPAGLYKNNSDHQGHSYGCHENYLLSAECFRGLFGRKMHLLFSGLIPFLVTRQIYAGAGKVGAENGGEPVDFQLSQRADFIETVMGLGTTERRPIVNTRDEPHADGGRFRRLHVTPGDSNMSEFASFLKIGTTQLVLAMMEDGALESDVVLADPVAAARAVSRDLSGARPLPLADGRSLSPVQIQTRFLQWSRRYLREQGEDPRRSRVIRGWAATLWSLQHEPGRLCDRLDWMIKLRLIERLRARERLGWEDPRLREMDIKYHDIHRERSPFYYLQAAGAVRRLVSERRIAGLVRRPPRSTRAYLRGRCVGRFAGHVRGADWERVEFGCGSLELPDPRGVPAEEVDRWLREAKRPEEVLARAAAGRDGGDGR